MNVNDQTIMLRRAVREPYAALTAVEVDIRALAVDLMHLIRQEIGERPFAEIAIEIGTGAGELHEQCRETVKEWPPEAGVLCLADETAGMDEETRRQFWVEMNALRESWAALNCHVIFFLLPGSYRMLTQIADHLADWIPLKLHFTYSPEQNGEMRENMISHSDVLSSERMSPNVARQVLAALERQLAEAILREDDEKLLVKRFYWPMFRAAVVLNELHRASVLREKIKEEDVPEKKLPEWWFLNYCLAIKFNKLSSAEYWVERLHYWAEKHENLLWQRQAYHIYGRIAQEKRDLSAAEKWFQKSLTIKVKQANDSSAALTYHQLGMIAEEQHDFQLAEQRYFEALAIKEALKYEHGAGITYHQLGMVAQKKRNFEKSEVFYKKALEIFVRHGDHHSAAGIYHQLGVIAQKKRDFLSAEKEYRKALTIFEKQGDRNKVAMTYHQLGTIAQEQLDLQTAEKWYRKAINIHENLDNKKNVAFTSHNLGMIAQIQGEFKTAEIWYQKSLEINEKLNNEYEMANTFGALGTLAGFQKKYEEAGKLFIKALILFSHYKNQYKEKTLIDGFMLLTKHAPHDICQKLKIMWKKAGLGEFPQKVLDIDRPPCSAPELRGNNSSPQPEQ